MTLPLLFAARPGIILWVSLLVMPYELTFEAIEAAINRELLSDG